MFGARKTVGTRIMTAKATRVGLSILALGAALAGSSVSANAEQYLLDMLFGNGARQQRPVERPREPMQQETRRTAPVPLVKVSAPSYYTYKPEALIKVDFGELVAALSNESEDTGATDRTEAPESSDFLKALSEISDFELPAEQKIAAAIIEHYKADPAFIWVGEEGPNEQAKAVIGLLNEAADFGLSETDYVVNIPAADRFASKDEDERLRALARFEFTLSARALRYARDAKIGRVHPNKLSGYHDFPAKPLDERAVLRILAGTSRPAAYLEAQHPQNALYAALRSELKTLRASEEQEIVVDPATFVRPGGSHSDFPKLLAIIERDADAAFRAEYGEMLAAHREDEETYAQELVPLIKAAQKLHDLKPDGIVGPQTVRALAGESRASRIEKVLLAMERLRWHPSHLGSTRVMINAPSFTASFVENNEEKLTMRAVVGTPSNQTNFFYDRIEYVEYNPYWGVPRSILVNEKLPRLRRDPGYLDRSGYEVINSSGQRVSSASIDWNRYGANIPFSVRQRPGPSNALGALKIMFPNKHNIYMHDTPAKHLFNQDTRAYSHGCVRLQDPQAMAAAVLDTSVEEVGSSISTGRNARQNLPNAIPVYVGYFTAWADASGDVTYHPDIYDRDAHLSEALAKVHELRGPGS